MLVGARWSEKNHCNFGMGEDGVKKSLHFRLLDDFFELFDVGRFKIPVRNGYTTCRVIYI